MSSADTENKYERRSLGYNLNKYANAIVKFQPTWHALNAAAAWKMWWSGMFWEPSEPRPVMKCWLNMNDLASSEVHWKKMFFVVFFFVQPFVFQLRQGQCSRLLRLEWWAPTCTYVLVVHSSQSLLETCLTRTFFFPNVRSAMVKEWPQRQAQTKAALKRKKPLEEKVLAEVRRRASQINRTLKPALDNSSASSNITKEVEQMANTVAKVCVCVCNLIFVKCLRNLVGN